MPKINEIRYAKDIGKKGSLYKKYIWSACKDCGKERWVELLGIKVDGGHPKNDLCNKCCHRCERSGKWRGGNSHNTKGYKTVMLHPSDFYYPMVDKMHYVLEHRLVMAKHIGRCLHPWETVHHKNHDKTDNRIENLTLEMTNGHQQITILESRVRSLEKQNRQLREELSHAKK